MKKTIYLKLEIDLDTWKGYEEVSDELTVEDAMENYSPKDGTTLTCVDVAWIFPNNRIIAPMLVIIESQQLLKIN